jgi:hypothetical protein
MLEYPPALSVNTSVKYASDREVWDPNAYLIDLE